MYILYQSLTVNLFCCYMGICIISFCHCAEKFVVAQVDSKRLRSPSVFHADYEIALNSTVKSSRCSACTKHHKSLSRMTECTPVVILHTVLRSPKIKVCFSQLHHENVCLKSQVTRLRTKINDAVNNDGVTVDPDLMMI